MKNTADGEQVGIGKRILEEVAGHDFNAVGDRARRDDLTSQGHGIGQIEDNRSKGGIALAGGTGQMPRGPTQIDETAEATEVKGGDDPRGAQQPEAMHAEQEFALRLFGTKEALKNRAL